jgi:hypothetical protein
LPASPRHRDYHYPPLQIGRCEKGDKVVIVAGSPPGTAGRTNALRVHTIGDAAALGSGLA